ncbi:MAG: DegQ family serine endoprotease [Myxococcota bacterium]|nr:DegQ family serine endoprotease [Myxococcota bacterium]
MTRTSTVLLSSVALAALLVVSGALDVRIQWGDNQARAIDLFGGDDDEEETPPAASGESFWNESEGGAPLAEVPARSSFADLAERVSPSVVNIRTSKKVQQGQGQMRVPPPFEPFFGNPFEEFFGGRREFKVPSLGSGFVISEEGYIVTNNHVVEDVDEIEVVFEDGTELEAKIVGRDPATDIALIQVEPEQSLTPLPLGDSSSMRPGDWVIAIGNPFGLEHTVTAGIVSALHRRNIGAGRYEDFIQTDAAINPGNSGGPLINLAGEVVGINTAINPRANTIGFAVPVNMAKEILPQLRTAGFVTRGWLGVVIQRITPDLQEALELDDAGGALVSRVDPKGPAADAGIERGDVIVRFDDKKVGEMEELPRLVAAKPPGSKAKVVVVRDGKEKSFTVALGTLEEGERVARADKPGGGGASAFGLSVQELTDELAEQLDVQGEQGVVVTQVEPGSPGAEAGLRRGDVVLEVNHEPVASPSAFANALEDRDKALLLVRRGEATIFVAVKRADED